jgi:hypothetical protein
MLPIFHYSAQIQILLSTSQFTSRSKGQIRATIVTMFECEQILYVSHDATF